MPTCPLDWPASGPIDLNTHDLPHRSADTEWWYINSHFEVSDGRKLSFFAAFFRMATDATKGTEQKSHGHALTWALIDPRNETYIAESRVEPDAPKHALERIKNGHGPSDFRLHRAITEVLESGAVPLPDRVFCRPVQVAEDRLFLDFGDAQLEKRTDGSYRLTLCNHEEAVSCDLTIRPSKPVIRHGEDGVVRGKDGEDMFYYFIPRCSVAGTVTLANKTLPITAGQAWYDHEFGGKMPNANGEVETSAETPMSWNWTGIQLDDGTDLSAYEVIDSQTSTTVGKGLIVVDPAGERASTNALELTAGPMWRSTRTFQEYPTSFTLRSDALNLNLTLEALFPDQEFITTISYPAFWEGACRVAGTLHGKPVTGIGFVERSGFAQDENLERFFSKVGAQVAKSVEQVLPLVPSHEQLRDLIANDNHDGYLDGVEPAFMASHLIAPIREITDRGGKAWRSYAALACCDVVGGDSRKYARWLALPELLHVGSLIVDDVQDRSPVRRGGAACHMIYGEPLALNAGTAAYFLPQNLLISEDMSAEQKLRLYDLYFLAMRAGHAGQALDHAGMMDLVPAAVETGNASALEDRILACYRLKTAAPAASLAAMGAVAGGGTEAQIEAVGGFFEALGVAFQIMDDVLNLRGFERNLKVRGEDIANGVITLPVAKAMTILERAQREELWQTLQSKPQDPQTISATVDQLEGCGAIEACARLAAEVVEEGWRVADAVLQPSMAKMMLRAFGWFVLERHY